MPVKKMRFIKNSAAVFTGNISSCREREEERVAKLNPFCSQMSAERGKASVLDI